jgi:hypothetical protein
LYELPEGYTVHPAFTNNIAQGGWDEELTGFWVAKFDPSFVGANASSIGTIATNGTEVRFIPSVRLFDNTSGASLNAGRAYTWGLEYNPGLQSHMMKNSEWGAVTYLTISKYGRNGTEVTNNNDMSGPRAGYAGNSINAGGTTTGVYPYDDASYGIYASSTANFYGIYDLSGYRYEVVAGYFSGGTFNILSYGSSFTKNGNGTVVITDSTKYATAYSSTVLDEIYSPGDGLYETSGWYSDAIYTYTAALPFMLRSARPGSTSGIFVIYSDDGNTSGNPFTYRVCLMQ